MMVKGGAVELLMLVQEHGIECCRGLRYGGRTKHASAPAIINLINQLVEPVIEHCLKPISVPATKSRLQTI